MKSRTFGRRKTTDIRATMTPDCAERMKLLHLGLDDSEFVYILVGLSEAHTTRKLGDEANRKCEVNDNDKSQLSQLAAELDDGKYGQDDRFVTITVPNSTADELKELHRNYSDTYKRNATYSIDKLPNVQEDNSINVDYTEPTPIDYTYSQNNLMVFEGQDDAMDLKTIKSFIPYFTTTRLIISGARYWDSINMMKSKEEKFPGGIVPVMCVIRRTTFEPLLDEECRVIREELEPPQSQWTPVNKQYKFAYWM